MKFVIKVIAKATEDNTNYFGQTNVSYCGKGEKLIGIKEIEEDMIETYGYNRKCDAVRMKNHLTNVLNDMTALGNKWIYELSVVNFEA